MPTFICKATTDAGEAVTREIEAASRKELMRTLKSLSLSPLEVEERAARQGQSAPSLKSRLAGGRVSGKELTLLTAQLSALVNAKMNLAKALAALEEQSSGANVKALVSSLLEEIRKGVSLSEALAARPGVFPPLYVNMVKVGETGGMLDKALQRLVEMRTKDEELAGKIKSALAYPCVMAAVMIASVIVMLAFVIPRFNGIFSQAGGSLPFPTKAVLASSSFLESWWWLLLIAAALAAAGCAQLLRKREFKVKFDRLKLSLPVLGGILRTVCLSRFSFSMGALLSGGVPMLKALEATAPVAGNAFIEEALRQAAQELREGSSLSAALRRRPEVFPALMTGMVGTGEDSGSLNDTLGNLGEYFRKESEANVNTLTTLLEPLMIVSMGGVVGFIVSAILLPIFNISSSVR